MLFRSGYRGQSLARPHVRPRSDGDFCRPTLAYRTSIDELHASGLAGLGRALQLASSRGGIMAPVALPGRIVRWRRFTAEAVAWIAADKLTGKQRDRGVSVDFP